MIPKTKRVLPVDEGTPAQRRVTRSMSAADPSLELSTDLPSRKRRRVAEVSTQPPRVAALALHGPPEGLLARDGTPRPEPLAALRLAAISVMHALEPAR